MIEIPNFPKKPVSVIALGDEFHVVADALRNRGIEVISIPKFSSLPRYEKCHADLRIHHLGSKDLMLYKEDKFLAKILSDKGFNLYFAKRNLSGKYPESAGLNALRIGNILLCNEKAIDPNLKAEAKKRSLEIIHTNQGYSRCASCIVSEKAVITSDVSIFNSLKNRVDALLIKGGHIRLSDTYDGMIGGASFMIDKNLIAFCGNIKAHPDFKNIEKFLEKYGVSYVCLTDEMLTDVGTAVILK